MAAEESKPTHIVVSWEQYGDMIGELSSRLRSVQTYKKWQCISGIPRGGLALAICLSYHLDLPLIALEKLYSSKGLKILLVDDISDTGDTLIKLKKHLEVNNHNVNTATLYVNNHTKFIPDVYLDKTDVWVSFPYEKIISSAPDTKRASQAHL